MKLAYLSDMFLKLDELNLQMQGTNTPPSNRIMHERAGDVGAASERGEYRPVWKPEIICRGQQAAEHSDPTYENSYVCTTKTFSEIC